MDKSILEFDDNQCNEQLPQDYQDHLDGKNETWREKNERLNNELKIILSWTLNKPIF